MNPNALRKLEKLREDAENLIDKRYIYFRSCSKKWQESEKGEAYQDKTERLDMFLDFLQDAVSSLREYLEM